MSCNKYFPKSNNIEELNKALKRIYQIMNCSGGSGSGFSFLHDSGNPDNGTPPATPAAVYMNTDDGTLWDWTGSAWSLFYTPPGTSLQDIDSVLGEGNTASDKQMNMLGDDSAINLESTDTGSSVTIGLDGAEPILQFKQNATDIGILHSNLVTGNEDWELPANSGTIALLSDIASGGPMIITTKTANYTLQIGDGDNNTDINLNSASDIDVTLDSAVAFPIGTSIALSRKGTGEVNIVPAGTTVIISANSATNLTYQGSGATLLKVSATEWFLFGDIGDPSVAGGPGGSDTQLQFNNAGSFGGIAESTYDPVGPTTPILDFTTGSSTRDMIRIVGPSASGSLFSVRDAADPANAYFFRVGGNVGYMSGSWIIGAGGNLTASTATTGLSDMLMVGNVAGTPRKYSLAIDENNFFAIRDVQANLTRISVDTNGIVSIVNTPVYADNAAALLGGLTAGNIYRTGDTLKIVH